MKFLNKLLLLYATLLLHGYYCDTIDGTYKWPTVSVSILVRNMEDSLPYFLTCLWELDYPKDRMYIWIHSDYNEDASLRILYDWNENHADEYAKLHLTMDRLTSGKKFQDQKKPLHWSSKRYEHVIKLRENALKVAKDSWADFIFMLDADVFLTNPRVLKTLLFKNYQVVAPMLISDGLYSNFWGGMTADYYYKRTDNYKGIISRKNIGCFNVPMVHSAVLISLNHDSSDVLTYNPKKLNNYDGPQDDIITFAVSARHNDINLTVCNDEIYGFFPVPIEEDGSTITSQVDNVKLQALGHGVHLPVEPFMEKYKTYHKIKYDIDDIFLINLERRKERKYLMMKSFEILGMEVKVINAVDGKKLSDNDLIKISLMPGYEDPFYKRPMKTGEIGCFLSHYEIWTEIVDRNLGISLVLEDDVHFVPYFRERLEILLRELKDIDWEFVYIGRKVLLHQKEQFVSDHLVKPLYSYWTLGYFISAKGADKLIKAEPLTKLLPVDEFLPIMFNQHPNTTWMEMFTNRDLKAFSAVPLLVHPTHYTGEKGYISDTEDSAIVDTTAGTLHKYDNEEL